MKVYTVYKGVIEEHEVIRETKTGWRVKCSYGDTMVTRRKLMEKRWFHVNTVYGVDNIDEARNISNTAIKYFNDSINKAKGSQPNE